MTSFSTVLTLFYKNVTIKRFPSKFSDLFILFILSYVNFV